tara:strand:- start:354 stop:497 length:144 start_codon:yes stop_codon:yes gene_type:complete
MTKTDYAPQGDKAKLKEQTIPHEAIAVALIAVTGFIFTLMLLLSLTN